MLSWLHDCNSSSLRRDAVAGLTTAAVVIPQAMAYAGIAGLPLEIGLYTALVPMLVYALLGNSRELSVSTTSTIAILTAAELSSVIPEGNPAALVGAAAALAMLVGAALLLAAVLRLGFVANFISHPVLVGFKFGIGLVILTSQIPKMAGLHLPKQSFLLSSYSIARHLPQIHAATLMLALGTLVLVFGLQRYFPRLPAALAAVVAGIALSALAGLPQRGVALVGAIPAGFPRPIIPAFDLMGKLWPGALGIALMAFTESIAAGRAFVRPGEPTPPANRELAALGFANLSGAFFSSMPAGGGMSQTAVNDHSGARTQIAELVTAALVAMTLLFLSPLLRWMPQATLAAVVVASIVGLLSPKELLAIQRVRRTEFYWGVAAVLGVILWGTLQGILVAVLISLLMLIAAANHPPVYAVGRKRGTDVFRPLTIDHPDDETFDGLLITRTEGRMTFASAPRTSERFWELIGQYKPRVILLDCSAIPDFEYTALKLLTEGEEKLRDAGIELWMAALTPGALDVVRRSALYAALGPGRFFFTVPDAVAVFLKDRHDHSA